MKRPATTAFLLFYATFTFFVQLERTTNWLDSWMGTVGSRPSVSQSQSQHAKQTRIIESGFVLHGFENAAALPEIISEIVSTAPAQLPAPALLNTRPRSPPVNLRTA